ncbi:MAG TPA: DUF3108 domain-containing protein [Mariprofundaceae bacterium]|nr:DUF3108 domain-containing protein [Mariprofundaceae bacterium]
MVRWLAALLLLMPSAAWADCMPYTGEKLVFSVGWEFINAGTATMDTSATKDGWRIATQANTNKFLDMFKKVRDTITAEGLCVNGRMQSTLFDVEQHERSYHASKQTRFLWKENKVLYTQNKQTDSYDVPAGHLSVMDAFFAVRQMQLKPGQTISLPVFDSRKRYEVVVGIESKLEKLPAPWGGFVDCVVVTPQLKTEGIFSSIGAIRIWLTNDSRRIPLKMTAAIKIGHIVAILDSYSEK